MKTNPILKSFIAGSLLLAAAITLHPALASAREHGAAAFSQGASGFTTTTRAPQIERLPTVTVPQGTSRSAALATVESRLARLDARLPAGTIVTEDVQLQRARRARTREYLYGLVNLGTPDWQLAAWTDALAQDEILTGMPADLVLDYWGNPLATDSLVVAGVPQTVWTYRTRPGVTERITVANGAVVGVRRL